MRPGVDLVIGNVGIVGKKKLFEPITVQIGNIHKDIKILNSSNSYFNLKNSK